MSCTRCQNQPSPKRKCAFDAPFIDNSDCVTLRIIWDTCVKMFDGGLLTGSHRGLKPMDQGKQLDEVWMLVDVSNVRLPGWVGWKLWLASIAQENRPIGPIAAVLLSGRNAMPPDENEANAIIGWLARSGATEQSELAAAQVPA